MAGDWIKMRADLLTHPKVVRMASALKADRLRVVGGLFAVWCLFDAHSVDGQLEGYTDEVLDSLVGFPGFAAGMRAIGWLEFQGDSLVTPRFDEHNGQSAKRRATEAQRKRDERKTSASDADKLRTREEKRREEKKEEGSASPRGSRLPADWTPSPEEVAYCRTARADLNPDTVTADFRDYWTSKPGKDGLKLDWHATWQMWVRNQRAPKPGILAAAGVVTTVPGKQERDPELVKREQDSKNAAPMPDNIREQIAKLKGTVIA